MLEKGWEEIIAKRPRSAIRIFEEYVATEPESPEGYRGKARAIADLAERGEATIEELKAGARCAQKALRLLSPMDDEAYKRTVIDVLDLAFEWSDADEGPQAWDFLTDARVLLPQSPEICNEIGNLAWGDYGERPRTAELAFQQTLKLCEETSSEVRGNALSGLMNIYLETHRYDEAYDVGFELWDYLKDSPEDRDFFVEMRLEELRDLGRLRRRDAILNDWMEDSRLGEGEFLRRVREDLLLDEVESLTRKVVLGQLRRVVGKGWRERLPPRTREIAEDRAQKNRFPGEAVPEFVDLEGWGRVITSQRNWPLFKDFFGEKGETRRRFRELRQLRNRIKHRGGRHLDDGEMEKLQDYQEWIRGAEKLWVSRHFARFRG